MTEPPSFRESTDRTFFDPITGRGICSTTQNIEPYPDWVDGIYDMGEYYFPAGVPTLRTKMMPTITGNDPALVGVAVSFTGFPLDAVFDIDGAEYQLDDGAINFTPTTVGEFKIQCFHSAHLDYGVTIYAN